MSNLPLHIGGIWVGECFEVTEGVSEESASLDQNLPPKSLLWTLTLVPDSTYPSAYGASAQKDNELPRVLHGTWDSAAKKMKVKENPPPPSPLPPSTSSTTSTTITIRQGVCEYTGYLQNNEGTLCIQGSWARTDLEVNTTNNTEQIVHHRGRFLCCKDLEDHNVHLSGLWIGQAVPDASLSFIPTNPIKWSMSLLNTPPEGVPSTFGCGYFDDSADIPNQPILFFTLHGTWDPSTSQIQLTKRYEEVEFTAGYDVGYVGALEKKDGSMWLKGKWENKKGGTFGHWLCRLQPASESVTAAICLCDVCAQPIKPGDVRWSCSTCLIPWCCCSGCVVGDIPPHPHSLTPEALYDQETARGACCAELAQDAFLRFSKRPFIATRQPTDPEFTWHSYGDVHATTLDFAFGLKELGIEPRSFILLCEDISLSYTVCMLGALLNGCVLVPVHGTLELEALVHVLVKTQPRMCIVDTEYLDKVNKAVQMANFKASPHFVQITSKMPSSSSPSADTEAPTYPGTLPLSEVLDLGHAARQQPSTELQIQRMKLEDITAVLFTSGSTGAPKGAIFTEELAMPSEGVANIQPFIRLDFQAYDPSFLLSVLQTMLCGGQRVFASSLQTLMQDFQLSRPTHLGATPIFWNSLYQDYLTQLSTSLQEEDKKDLQTRKSRRDLENKVADNIRKSLGNRLFVATSGGAPISPEVLNFTKTMLRISIVNLYGSRESGGITRDGVVYPGVDVKLLSLPELGYFADRHPPQGEICVHSPRLIPGYFNDPDLTANTFVLINDKKYYRTGDVGELNIDGQNRYLRVIDRTGAFIKLAQGEWVSPTHIETVLEQCPWVHQALVLGSPLYNHTVAVIVPSQSFTEFWAIQNSDTNSAEATATCTRRMLDEIRFWCVHHHLRPIEIPQALFLESIPWSVSNGFLTSTEKKRRALLQSHYRQIQENLYSKMTLIPQQQQQIINDSDTSTAATLPDSFLQILGQVCTLAPSPLSPSSTFAEIGGDSLSAARLANMLSAKFNIQLTVQDLFEYPLGHLSQLLDAQSGYNSNNNNNNNTRHALMVQQLPRHKIDWASEWTLPANLLSSPSPADSIQNKNVLITGCTGFLGPVLVSEVLKQLPSQCKVYCLVRGKDKQNSTDRLVRDMKKAGMWVGSHLDRLVVLNGDLAKDHFGLTDSQYNDLATQVSDIYHSGAWVNMTLPYVALKPVNVSGTIRIIKLALAARAKVHYISSVSALPAGSGIVEDWVTLDPVQMEKKDGYGQTKVVSERLLQSAHTKYGLHVTVYRPSSISGLLDTTEHFTPRRG